MTTCVTDQVVFLHTPKTGGLWITQAFEASGIQTLYITELPHISLFDFKVRYPEHREKFFFSFVRHPIYWWQSYWRYKRTVGWDPDNDLDMAIRSDDFETFVENILLRFPGTCFTYFQNFTGPLEQSVNFIGRYENLVDDFLSVVTRFHEVDEPAVRSLMPINESDKKFSAEFRDCTLLYRLYFAEIQAFERYNYMFEVTPDLLEKEQ